jgi:hypothetical protein
MDSEGGKNEVGHKTSLGDLERAVKVRKYQHCEAEYSQLAKEPNTMPEVRDRYLRIAQYYRELADTEPASTRAGKRDNFQAPASSGVTGSIQHIGQTELDGSAVSPMTTGDGAVLTAASMDRSSE